MKRECNVQSKVLIDYLNSEEIDSVYVCKINSNKECKTELFINWQIVSLPQLFFEVTLFFELNKKHKHI